MNAHCWEQSCTCFREQKETENIEDAQRRQIKDFKNLTGKNGAWRKQVINIYGISGIANKLMRSYLENRYQRV
jgi:hypothetical protein